MESISPNTKVTPHVAASATTAAASKQASEAAGAIGSDLPKDQSVQAQQKADAVSEGTKESALARVEKALSEAFGDGFANLRIEVEKHEESGRFVYKAVNKQSGHVERQFPSEDMLKILTSLEGRDGKFLDNKA